MFILWYVGNFKASAVFRVLGTLGESPEERFSREKEALKPVPSVEPTVLYEREIRRVSNDGYISYRGRFYPVPMRLCLQEVWVECQDPAVAAAIIDRIVHHAKIFYIDGSSYRLKNKFKKNN